ncbi:MAG: A/G-specific adenine glycosylase [Sphingomonadales bacterium]|nr:A/G-specific adenine glycosylase [Sphingomonadales bacterium]
MDASAATISQALLDWYDRCARVLPWRSPPGSPPPDPYRVWLSEVMLQQTTTAAVAPYFARFLDRWPTVEALAAADDADVMAAWAGLGYYARARNLLACARAVVARGGEFPQTQAELGELPGLGAYTAAAIAAIAFGQRAVVVDANVERVVARLFAISDPLPAARKAIHARAGALTPAVRPGDFAQAMMDLGATICIPRAPRCSLCPLADSCAGRGAEPERFPVKAARKPRPTRTGRAFWIALDGAVVLVKRPAKGMLGGMRALPDDGWTARGDGQGTPPLGGSWRSGGVVRHTFSHFDLELQLMLYSGGDCFTVPTDGEWWPIDRLDDAGLPSVFAKAARLALA